MPNQFNNRQNTINTAMSNIATSKIDFKVKPVPLKTILSELNPQGIETTMEAVIGKHITVWQVIPFASDRFGPAALAIFTTDEGELLNMVVGQSVCVPKFIMASDQVPFDCTLFIREGGLNGVYYDVK